MWLTILRLALPWILAGGVVAGAYGLVTKRAYDRGHEAGVSETTVRMTKAIAAMKAKASDNSEKWKRTPAPEKATELQKRCVAACEQEPKCEAACKQ